MKLKRLISKSLAIGLLFNSGLTSFAGTLSEDGRYKTFEGNNIAVDNILEEDKVDIEIEGNTMVNYVNLEEFYFNGDRNAVTINPNSVVIKNPSTWTKAYYYFNLKPNTTYTLKVGANNSMNKNIASYIRFNHDISSEYAMLATLFDFGEKTTKTKVFTTKNNGKVCLSLESPSTTGVATYSDVMLLEGDWTDKEIPEYFEGMKSVGELEDNKIEIKSQNKNLFNIHKVYSEGYGGRKDEAYIEVVNNSLFISKKTIPGNMVGLNIKCQKGKTYTLGFIGGINSNGTPNSIYVYEDKFWGKELFKLDNDSSTESVSKTFVATSDEIFVGCYLSGQTGIGEVLEYKNIFVIEGENCEYIQYTDDLLQYTLNEPLRGVGNIKDRIIKKNGQWVVERNCGEIILNGSEGGWRVSNESYFTGNGYYTFCIQVNPTRVSDFSGVLVKSDRFNGLTYEESRTDMVGCVLFDNWGKSIGIKQTIATNLDEFKTWLQANPVKVVYVLSQSIYEPLNISPTLNTYLDITHISNNSTIPANMKITIDRTLNRAIEAIELAKSNPTIENLSKARMWSNLLKESIKKDELQNEINTITDIDDLQIEKKNTTANMDLYIKPQNSLSMSLSTNSILFDEFSGVEDMEKLNAIEITINSSLPYQLNSYLESEIKNSDGSKIIPKELLNIRLNGENDYKAFSNINEKLVLKENCLKGNDNQFNIDLILKGSLTHKADIYKTVIKFEAEQK